MATIEAEGTAYDYRVFRKIKSDRLLAALLTSFGGGGANVALRSAHFFAEQVLATSPGSPVCGVALRLFYLSSAAAAVALDYVAAQSSFQPAERRRTDIEDSIRYGTDHDETKSRLDLALQLTRQYLPNGAAVANQLRDKIATASNEIPADIIGEVVSKMVGKGNLFESAKILESAAHLRVLPAFGSLAPDAKAFSGAVLDFCGIDREQFAKAWRGDVIKDSPAETLPLSFPEPAISADEKS